MKEIIIYKKMRAALPHVHFERIENAVGVGAFDVNGCHDCVEFWVELKLANPKPLMRLTQWAWGNRRYAAGGIVNLLALNPKTKLIYLYKPPYEIDINDKRERNHAPLLSDPFMVFNPPYNWKLILSYLKTK